MTRIAHFLFYTRPNFSFLEKILDRLQGRGVIVPKLIQGFDFEEFRGAAKPFVPPGRFSSADIVDYASPETTKRILSAPSGIPELAILPFPSRFLLEGVLKRPYVPALIAEYARVASGILGLIHEEHPSYVVLPEDTDYIRGRLAARLLREHGIPTVVLSPTYYPLMIRYPLIAPRLADYYLVLNEFVRERLLRQGVATQRIFVTGSPLLQPRPKTLPPDRPCLLFVLQNLSWEKQIADDLLDIAASLPGVDFIFKEHPAAPSPLCHGSFPSNVRALGGRHAIAPLLASVTAVIGQTSSALYEALASGTRIVVVHYGGGPPEIFLPEALTREVMARTYSELRERLLHCLEEPSPSYDTSALLPSKDDAVTSIVSLLESLFPSML